MTAAQDLWTAVKANYDESGLVSLTNIRVTSSSAIDDDVGEAAAQATINLWHLVAQIDYDPTETTHVEIGMQGTIATLWKRGATSSTIEQVKWDTVFGSSGLLVLLKNTGPRARIVPESTSGVIGSSLSRLGPVRPWSDPDSLPRGFLIPRRGALE